MAAASNYYYLNGVDLYDVYGFAVADGSDDLLRPPSMDDPDFHKFTDQNGVLYDLSSPTFTPGEALLKGTLMASTTTDFWNKYNALFNVLKSPGVKQLIVTEFDRVFEVFYRDVPTIHRHTRLKDPAGNKIRVKLEIRFTVVNSYSTSGVNYYYAGSASTFPVSWTGGITALSAFPEYLGNIFDMNTGTVNKTFVLAIPQNKSLKRVIDLSASNVNLTALFAFQRSITNPNGVVYNEYGFSQSVPYSTNHVYRFELM